VRRGRLRTFAGVEPTLAPPPAARTRWPRPAHAWRRLESAWSARDRDEKTALIGVAALLAGAIAVRAWLMIAYGPAFVGFADSHDYLHAAAHGVFLGVEKPAGYPVFLDAVHFFSDQLSVTILVQHALGVATGLLLYTALRRTGAPAWLGLAPAAVVFFGGTGLLLEHSLLADSLFAFLQAAGVYAATRALYGPELRWPALAGVAIGASFWVRTVGLSSAVLVPVLLLAGAPGPVRRRLLSAATAAGAAAVVILGYVPVQALATGYWGYQRASAWNLYGRVATFVDCSSFTPAPAIRFLCPPEPLGHRQGENFFQYSSDSPAVARFGGPSRASARDDALLWRFDLAAIEHEPLAYAGAILRSLSFYPFPRGGEGYTPEGFREALLEPSGATSIERPLAAYYASARGYESSAGASVPLDSYEQATRIQGPLLIALLAAALAGTALAPGRARAVCALFTLTAILSVAIAAAGNGYDARYGYPAYGPLAGGAALGAWGVLRRLRRARRARRSRPLRGVCRRPSR